jgi:signal transduction histidine kinase/CheY-like chemotaxis protein
MRHKNGTWRMLESTASAVRNAKGETERLVIVNRDITERKQAEKELQEREQQLRQAVKMEAVGRLSGGIAHDFNNLLSVIIGYADELNESKSDGDKLRRNAEQIKKAGQRAASLTRQLLAFSRQQVLQPRVLDLNSVVADLAKMLRRLIGADIELTLTLDPEVGSVKADPSQIDQVLMNLVVNARDAMPEGGQITIETSNTELTQGQAAKMPYVQPGPYVQLTVTDTGIGMDAETMAHIFEPFFTTKEKGQGTGLGLATVYGIIKQSGGYIWVFSEPGRGTSFKIFLPRVMDAAPAVSAKTQPAKGRRALSTVLLVEDEDSLRELIAELLARDGYHVLAASNGAQAVETARSFQGPIHLLLTDIVLPGISGTAVAKHLAASRPEMKILYMSGYSEFHPSGRGSLPPDARLLQKPFTKETLLRDVAEALSPAGVEIHT